MNRGFKVLMIGGCLIAAGCATHTRTVQVRAIPDQSAKLRAGSGELAQAKTLLALGNVGLALEGFRKTLRDQPTNADAMAGIGACYAAMGRYDLAQTNYEAALAQAPQNTNLLMALADSLDAQGKISDAATARADAVRITRASPPGMFPPEPAVALAEPSRPAVSRLPLVHTVGPLAVPSSSVTVRLPPPARAAETVGARPLNSEKIASSAPTAQTGAPRLERLSTGEVALVTTREPLWQAQLVPSTRLYSTAKWVPIQSASAARTGIQVLNAARSGGLAARARNVLFGRGWRGIRIGDAPQVRANSIVYFPAGRSMLGRSLAAQFGIHMLQARDTGGVVVLLGRDAAGLKAAQRRG